MRLLTHNMLVSNAAGVAEGEGYPLGLEVTEQRTEATEFDADFVRRTLRTVKYDALVGAAKAAGCDVPDALDDADDAQLRRVHTALHDVRARRAREREFGCVSSRAKKTQVHVIEGCLVCPKSGRRFPITNGIPNMLLHEDEVAGV